MKVEKIIHRDLERIKIDFPYNTELAAKLRQLPDCKWSQTHKAWHIPYTKPAFTMLQALFPGVTYDKASPGKPKPGYVAATDKPALPQIKAEKAGKGMSVTVIGRKALVRLPKNPTDTKFLLSIRYSRWHTTDFCWHVPAYPANLELLKAYFKERITTWEELDQPQLIKGEMYTVAKNQVLAFKTLAGRVRLLFGFHKGLTTAIQKIPYYYWDAKNKWWTIPYAEKFLDTVKSKCLEYSLTFTYEEEKPKENKVARITPFDIPNYRPCPEGFLLKLRELRYSESTLKTYANFFEEFINYYHRHDYNDIDETMIISYLRYLVTERKVSSSYQNQAINAIKFYYERVLGGKRKFYFPERPLKEKSLPIVLSEAEVAAVIKAIANSKHKAMLMLIYSAGLRVSELLNLTLKDIDSDRMQIRIA